MIEALISSKTRIKLLLKLFLNSSNRAYLRGLEEEFGESSNAIRLELNRFEEAGMITGDVVGNKKFFTANTQHPLFKELNSILYKYIGIDTIIERVITQIGDVKKVYLSGSLAMGKDATLIDLEFIGKPNMNYLVELVAHSEEIISRKIRYIVYSEEEFEKFAKPDEKRLLIWSKELL